MHRGEYQHHLVLRYPLFECTQPILQYLFPTASGATTTRTHTLPMYSYVPPFWSPCVFLGTYGVFFPPIPSKTCEKIVTSWGGKTWNCYVNLDVTKKLICFTFFVALQSTTRPFPTILCFVVMAQYTTQKSPDNLLLLCFFCLGVQPASTLQKSPKLYQVLSTVSSFLGLEHYRVPHKRAENIYRIVVPWLANNLPN